MWQCSSTAGTKGTRTHSHEDCVCPYDDNYQDGHSAARHHAAAARIRARCCGSGRLNPQSWPAHPTI